MTAPPRFCGSFKTPSRWVAGALWAILAVVACRAESEPDEKARTAQAERRQLSERILQNTKTARDQLAEKITDAQTQDVQSEVVRDLERLIELLRTSPPPSGGSSSSPPQSPDQPPDAGQPQSPSTGKSSGQPSAPQVGAEKNRPKAEASEERHGEAGESKIVAERRRRLESDIWGHLPPALREQLLNTYGERMLPQYEEFVRRFYEALSEPARPQKR